MLNCFHIRFRYVLLAFCLLITSVHQAKNLQKAYKALAIYDYFKAKHLFEKINRKKANAFSSYGLALIYARNDNPFSNPDSAVKYAQLAFNLYKSQGQPYKDDAFLVDSAALRSLVDTIAQGQFIKARRQNTILALEQFLTHNYLANPKLLRQAVFLRDELEYNHVMELNNSDSSLAFILTHPLSSFLREAQILMDRELYDEQTDESLPSTFNAFIKRYPKNVMVNMAYEKLFGIYRQRSDAQGLADFVKNYPAAPQYLEAWKLLFSLSVKAYSFSELKRFLEEYPDFPLKYSILKELELNKLVLYPFQQGDFVGFINEEGKFAIEPVYDAATEFYQGLAVVSKNDSVFFINKENNNPFNAVYSDAMVFRNGIAPVKTNNQWYFINRQGQTISGTYDELNELSNQVYVVKKGEKYGAIDQYGQVLIEPKFDKLGDFKNDLAYYSGDGKYGFVALNGATHKAEFDWISDFDDDLLAIYKQNNKYGLVNSMGKKILEADYDQVIRAAPGVFLVTSNNLYGFYSPAGCFIAQVMYEYQKDKQPAYYTNGRSFRLLKKPVPQIVDVNGQSLINPEPYAEINFASNGLMRVKKKKKYGYLDSRQTVAIPFKFAWAGDFSDSLALVTLKDNYVLINLQGKEVFSSTHPIEKLSRHYYLTTKEPKCVLDNTGKMVFQDVQAVKRINKSLLIITLSNNENKLLND